MNITNYPQILNFTPNKIGIFVKQNNVNKSNLSYLNCDLVAFKGKTDNNYKNDSSYTGWVVEPIKGDKPYGYTCEEHNYYENGNMKISIGRNLYGIDSVFCISPGKYFDILDKRISDKQLKFSYDNRPYESFNNLKETKIEFERIKKELGDSFKLNDINDAKKVFDSVGINAQKTEKGLTVSEYRQPFPKITFEELNVDEDKLAKYLNKIQGNANFSNSNITKLNNLEFIGGSANFSDSNVKEVNNLEFIGGDADFSRSKISNLNALKVVGGKGCFKNKELTLANLKNLDSINGKEYTPLKAELMKENLNSEKILNFFDIKSQRDNDGLLSISHYAQPYSFDFKQLGLDDEKLLKNVKRIEGDADFSGLKINSLENLQEINGDVRFNNSKINNLSNLTKIDGYAQFLDTQIEDLSKLSHIGKYGVFENVNIGNLNNLRALNGHIRNSYIDNLGSDFYVHGDIGIINTQIGNPCKIRNCIRKF